MRFDAYVSEKRLCPSRTKAAEAISRGEILLNGKIVTKPSYKVDGTETIGKTTFSFVSLGGYKLEKAFLDFPSFRADGKTFADVGASTGGFTECLLRHGAKKVYAIDVGESLLSEDLRKDPKVIPIERCNARNMTEETIGEKTEGAVCDVSFISLKLILKPIYDILCFGGEAMVLIKPQFECGKKALNKNGIVKDEKNRKQAVDEISAFARSIGFSVLGVTEAPPREGKNIEYLLYLKKHTLVSVV